MTAENKKAVLRQPYLVFALVLLKFKAKFLTHAK